MKITEVYLDGYRNIVDTHLDFKTEPLIVLLAPNNYGKSNLLYGIYESFEFLRKNGTAAVKYIQNAAYQSQNLNATKKFTFEVKFSKRHGDVVYKYKFVIDSTHSNSSVYDGKKYDDEFKDDVIGIVEEELYMGDKCLFIRDKEDLNVAYLNPDFNTDYKKNRYIINAEKDDLKGEYPHTFYLFLHKLGNMSLFDGEKSMTERSNIEIIDEIQGVFTSLTREDIGLVIADERTEYISPTKLSKVAFELKKQDEEKGTIEYKTFKKLFHDMFDYYDEIILQELKNSGQYQLVFHDKRKNIEVTTSDLSYGTRRIFKLLSQIFANNIPLISLEELENGLHPVLYRQVIKAFLFSLDEKKIQKRNSKNRKNDPRLIISSHAPGIVNRLDTRLDAVYVGMPDVCNNGTACFKKMNAGGQKELRNTMERIGGVSGAGDIIFQLLFNTITNVKQSEEWFYEQ